MGISPFAKVRGDALNLTTVQDIQRAIADLTPEQREELCVWLDEHYPQPVEARLKSDIEAGRFDERISRAVADHKAGRTQRL